MHWMSFLAGMACGAIGACGAAAAVIVWNELRAERDFGEFFKGEGEREADA